MHMMLDLLELHSQIKGDTVDVTLKTLNAGDKVSIAGKNYTIGSSIKETQALVDNQKKVDGAIIVNGEKYTWDNTGAGTWKKMVKMLQLQ